MYLDAGNSFVEGADLRESLLAPLLRVSHATAPFLPCCLESDWARRDALARLGADDFAILDRRIQDEFCVLGEGGGRQAGRQQDKFGQTLEG